MSQFLTGVGATSSKASAWDRVAVYVGEASCNNIVPMMRSPGEVGSTVMLAEVVTDVAGAQWFACNEYDCVGGTSGVVQRKDATTTH